jgi:hypothetical protein
MISKLALVVFAPNIRSLVVPRSYSGYHCKTLGVESPVADSMAPLFSFSRSHNLVSLKRNYLNFRLLEQARTPDINTTRWMEGWKGRWMEGEHDISFAQNEYR